MRGRKTAANCESCMNYEYDDDYECYVCTQDLDEDEMVRFVQGDFRECPYYQVVPSSSTSTATASVWYMSSCIFMCYLSILIDYILVMFLLNFEYYI